MGEPLFCYNETVSQIVFLILFSCNLSFGQDEEKSTKGSEIEIFSGPLLPNQVENMTEIMPTSSLREGIRRPFGGLTRCRVRLRDLLFR